MKKIALALGLLGLTALANAADPLNGTSWKTIDDKTNQPKAIVKFKLSVFKNFQFKLSISDFQNSEHFIFRTSVKFNFRKFDRVDLRKNIADNGTGLCEVAENRRRKFRFRRNAAKANFYLLI